MKMMTKRRAINKTPIWVLGGDDNLVRVNPSASTVLHEIIHQHDAILSADTNNKRISKENKILYESIKKIKLKIKELSYNS